MLQLDQCLAFLDLALQDEEAVTRGLAEVQIVAQDISLFLGAEDGDTTDMGHVVIVRGVVLQGFIGINRECLASTMQEIIIDHLDLTSRCGESSLSLQ